MAGITYCPRCGGETEIGFLVDASFGGEYAEPAKWAEGKPITSFWSGLKNKTRRPIDTYRCMSCGYLESYAVKEQEP